MFGKEANKPTKIAKKEQKSSFSVSEELDAFRNKVLEEHEQNDDTSIEFYCFAIQGTRTDQGTEVEVIHAIHAKPSSLSAEIRDFAKMRSEARLDL